MLQEALWRSSREDPGKELLLVLSLLICSVILPNMFGVTGLSWFPANCPRFENPLTMNSTNKTNTMQKPVRAYMGLSKVTNHEPDIDGCSGSCPISRDPGHPKPRTKNRCLESP